VKHGAIVYLDEIVEARKDTTVIIHPLSDDRRSYRLKRKARFSKRPTTSSWSFPIIPVSECAQRFEAKHEAALHGD
jgi:AAA domain (dynein-related subfamily).